MLVMHEPLGSALASCVRHVLGTSVPLQVVDVPADADVSTYSERIYRSLCQAGTRGSLVLCDLYGATPFNIARHAVIMARENGLHVELLTGANLNMVIKAVTDRISNVRDLCESAQCGAVRGIVSPDDGLPDQP